MLITLDFETAYGIHPVTKENLTLSKMTTEEYIRHPLFKVHCVGIKIGDAPAFVVFGDKEIRRIFAKIPWDRAAALAHHAHFDGAILNWIYGYRPSFWVDTLSMANALFPWESSSLASVCKRLGLAQKGTELALSKNLWTLPPDVARTLGSYCINDVEITRQAYDKMAPGYPASELRLIDATVRLFTEPCLVTDQHVLLEEYRRELKKKRAFMRQAGADRETLMSNDKLAAALENLGVVPPTKISPTTGKQAYAFAKNDEEFKQLLDHENEQVRWLVEARIANKTTIKETRTKRLFKIGTRGTVPIYLRYYGAHTGRWSGGEKLNPQNLPRYNPEDPTSGALRRALLAPEGHVCVVRDLGQIEARMLAYVAGQQDLLDVFRAGGDPYCHMASRLFSREISKKDKAERQAGKAVILGCGYQMGWAKFQDSLRVGFLGMPGVLYGQEMADALKLDVSEKLAELTYSNGQRVTLWQAAMQIRPAYVDPKAHLLHCAVVKTIIDRYREANDKVVALWSALDGAIASMIRGNPVMVGEGVQLRCAEDSIWMPNGMRLQYHHLDGKKTYISATRGQSVTRSGIYGGRAVENCLTAGTKVLTPSGWVPIVEVTVKDKVWDGREWVTHSGLLYKGEREVLPFGGIGITPEHLVLVNNSWVPAERTSYEEATSSFQRHNRLPNRGADRRALRRKRREKILMGSPLHVREKHTSPRNRATKRQTKDLRVPNKRECCGAKLYTRDVEASGLLGMALHAGSLQTPLASSVEELWGARDRGNVSLGYIRAVLGGHGTDLPPRIATGQARQQQRVLPRELSLGSSTGECPEQAEQQSDFDSRWGLAPVEGGGGFGHPQHDSLVSSGSRLATGAHVRSPGRKEQVFDLLNAGPRHCFTVCGESNRPFIVHNCVQALSRIVIAEHKLKIAERYKVATTTHDEIVAICPEEEASEALTFMGEVMAVPPHWAPDLPLTSDGGFNRSYGLCEK